MEFAMNFFEHQDRARRKTGMLVWLFVVAVAGLIAGTYVLIMSLYLGGLEQAAQQREALIHQFGPDRFWRPDIFIGSGHRCSPCCWWRKPF